MRSWSLVLLVAVAACGSGGDSSEQPAFATLLFPFDGGVTDSPDVTVRGTTPGAVAVSVNGVDATSGDGFLTWRAVVALSRGSNEFGVDLETGDRFIFSK
ncbi:MAG: hypothetical protein ACYTGZ_01875 [Planctomycetota bacterium]|jgi:hypothetical protein